MSLSIESAIKDGIQTLAKAGVTEARREAGSLLAHVLRRERGFIIAHADDSLTDDQIEAFRFLTRRRSLGEPLQYLTGHQEFFKLDFEVTPDVLIPRPETELIVELALDLLRDDPEPFFADIGTGSGCIAISLLHEMPNARAVATDISPAALAVAERNAERHEVSSRLTLLDSDCMFALDPTRPFALIVSNPPYISDRELKEIQREVKEEPQAALAGGPDGLAVIRQLLREAPAFVAPQGYLVFEIGFGQGAAINQLISADDWEHLGIRNDLQSIPRTVVLRKK